MGKDPTFKNFDEIFIKLIIFRFFVPQNQVKESK